MHGGGLHVGKLRHGERVVVSHSTISGNDSTETGGGIRLGGGPAGGYTLDGDFLLENSTVSGNTAGDLGGGVSVGGDDTNYTPLRGGAAEFANSTVAANTAVTAGGGFHLATYDAPADGGGTYRRSSTIPLTSTIVADNGPQDLDQADDAAGGGFDLAFTLVESAGDATLFQGASDHNIVGSDPQLGGLGSNGGPTQTHVPTQTSPAIDRGDTPALLETDQRGEPRTLDGSPPNPEGGDGTDIGSVEIARVPAPAATPPQTTPPPVPQPITRVRPGGISFRVRPGSDLTAPYKFRITGRIIPPDELSVQQACSSLGLVSMRVKRRATTISNRRTRLRPDCSFASSVRFRNDNRFGSVRRLTFTVRFQGNERLEAIASRSLFRRVRPAAGGGRR